jgi:CRISPR/Cas system CMR-associated protein Cmr3 (group 5 of RAMP superfamily)
MLRFSDGVNIDTSGELRKLKLSDGLYVVGKGYCIPANSEEEVSHIISMLSASKRDKSD